MKFSFLLWLTFVQSLNGWTFAFQNYYELNITKTIDNPNLLEMSKLIDPYCMLIIFYFLLIYFFMQTTLVDTQKRKSYKYNRAATNFFCPTMKQKRLIDAIEFYFHFQDTFWRELQVITGGSYLRYHILIKVYMICIDF